MSTLTLALYLVTATPTFQPLAADWSQDDPSLQPVIVDFYIVQTVKE